MIEEPDMAASHEDRGEKLHGRFVGRGGSLPVPGFSVVGTAPDFVVTGGNYNLRRTRVIPQIAAQFIVPQLIVPQLNVSYVRTKLPRFDGRLHLHPGYPIVSGVEERARLPARPYVHLVTRVAEQWMVRVQSILPALTAVQ